MPDNPPPHGPADPTACPGPCGGTRPPGKYVCPSCWHRMTLVTRAYLKKQDDLAIERYQQLVEQFGRGVPPCEIRVIRSRWEWDRGGAR